MVIGEWSKVILKEGSASSSVQNRNILFFYYFLMFYDPVAFFCEAEKLEHQEQELTY